MSVVFHCVLRWGGGGYLVPLWVGELVWGWYGVGGGGGGG